MISLGNLDLIRHELIQQLKQATTRHDCLKLKAEYLSRKGVVRQLYKQVSWPSLSAVGKKQIQQELLQFKLFCSDLIETKINSLGHTDNEFTYQDFTLPPKQTSNGSLHPLSILLEDAVQFFQPLGFVIDNNYEELIDPYYNFCALNVPKQHPSRSKRDTFYIHDNLILRTHTTSHSAKLILTQEPPLKIVNMGPTYRRDQDSSHTPMFHQIDCLLLDDQVNLQQGIQLVLSFINHVMGRQLQYRLRPGYFPFTEPSLEVDMLLNDQWLEILGCGLVHPKVLAQSPYLSASHRSFACGIGVERLLMAKYQLPDIHCLYQNDIRFLKQFARDYEVEF